MKYSSISNFNVTYKKKILLLLFCFSTTFFAQKPDTKIDSIIKTFDRGYLTGETDHEIHLKNAIELYYVSQKAGNSQGMLRSLLEQANIYYRNGNSDDCLEKINEGTTLAKSIKDYNALCRLLLIYQKLLYRLRYLYDAKKVITKCEEYNRLVKNKDEKQLNAIHILLSKAEILVNNEGLRKDMAPVLKYKKQAYTEALRISHTNIYRKFTLIYSLQSLAWSTALADNCSYARDYIEEIDRLLANYPNTDLVIENLIIKGAIENLDANYHAAKQYLSKAIIKAKETNNIYKIYEVYPMISASHVQMEDYKYATVYSYRFTHMTDSIDLVAKRSNARNFINKINLKVDNKKETKRSFVLIIIVVIAFLLILIDLLVYKRKKINPEKVELSKINKDSYSEENIKKEQEISKKLMDLAKTDINAFYLEFQKVYPTFYKSLKDKFPNLNVSDLNFCTLVKMNFQTKQIAVFTNSTLRSVESRRYRIMKKMEIKSQNDLYFMISNLS